MQHAEGDISRLLSPGITRKAPASGRTIENRSSMMNQSKSHACFSRFLSQIMLELEKNHGQWPRLERKLTMILNHNARERKSVLPPFRRKALSRGSPVVTLVVTCLGFFMVLLDASIVNVALPTIQADLHAHLLDLQWVVDAYTLPFAALLLTAGTLGDRYGRKRLFFAGLLLFLAGSTLCGFARTLELFLLGRVIQGLG